MGHSRQFRRGRASARETLARVIAGSVAEQILRQLCPGVETLAYVSSIGGEEAEVDEAGLTRAEVEAHPLRCPDLRAPERFTDLVSGCRR